MFSLLFESFILYPLFILTPIMIAAQFNKILYTFFSAHLNVYFLWFFIAAIVFAVKSLKEKEIQK